MVRHFVRYVPFKCSASFTKKIQLKSWISTHVFQEALPLKLDVKNYIRAIEAGSFNGFSRSDISQGS